MTIKLLTEHHLEFLSLTGGFTGSFECTLVKIPHCWKSHVTAHIIIPAFSLEKKGYINFVSKSVRRPSVRLAVSPSVTFLVNVYPPKPLEVAASNLVVE